MASRSFWAVVVIGIAHLDRRRLQRRRSRHLARILNIGLFLFVPIGFIWAIASMIWRTQEMRIVARSITEVVARLSEPENIATDAVVNVSQAIRREVAAVGDGIERALARASELELLVHNEVAALERSYSDNETRMRSLIDDLAGQREAIVINSERVRTSIVSAQESLSKDLRIASRVDRRERHPRRQPHHRRRSPIAASRSPSRSARAGETMVEQLAARGEDLVTRLADTVSDVAVSLAATGAEVTDALLARSAEINDTLATTGRAMADTIAERGREVNDTLARVGAELIESFDGRTEEITRSISETGNLAAETISTHVKEVNEALKTQRRLAPRRPRAPRPGDHRQARRDRHAASPRPSPSAAASSPTACRAPATASSKRSRSTAPSSTSASPRPARPWPTSSRPAPPRFARRSTPPRPRSTRPSTSAAPS